ncbi:MAG: hypothetical protein A2W19_03145 [Spirochaetes bacterium RBG_16_49_21]|nr:MAG: hypothetical protein A2W19_03145 [Spirochaetes bacterium RBG_16_49_21]
MKIIKQLPTGNKDNMKNLSFELESLIYTNIKESYPENWNRELLTRSIFSDMKKLFHGKKIHTPGSAIKSLWHLYQLKKNSDSIFGDAAIIMQISYHDGQIVHGAAFYDIAEKEPAKNSFSVLNKNRLRKLSSFAHHAQLLLYDYDPIAGMAFPSTADSVIGYHPPIWSNWIPYTHAVTVPANLAFTLGLKTTGLYKVSVPFSYQLCYRYLYGLDLDFNKQQLETAAGVNTARGNPKFLIQISASHGGALLLDNFEVDKSRYSEFE